MQVVIVESPAKAKTINKYLGTGFKVLASYGHIRDLPAKDGSVRPDEDFAMDWEADERGERQVGAIAKALKGARRLFLATDPDREGEAISWHVQDMLARRGALKGIDVKRITFNEITKRAVQHAVANPRQLDVPLIDAYLARLPAGRAPRILGSRTLFVADRRDEALRWAEAGLRRVARRHAAQPSQWAARVDPQAPLADLIAAYDVHVGTPDEVIASLRADTALARVSDIVFQVHSIDPPHDAILRSIELTAAHVAPALGWRRADLQAPSSLPAARAGLLQAA